MTLSPFAQPFSGHLPMFPRMITNYLVDAGFSEQEIFRGLTFSRRELDSVSFRLTTEQHKQFIKRAVQITGDPHLALAIQEHAFKATSSAVLVLLATSGRISKALGLAVRYNPIYTRTLTVRLKDVDSIPVMVIDCHLDDEAVAYFAVTSFVLFIDSFFQSALDGRHLVTHASLAMAQPPKFDSVKDQFGFSIAFNRDQSFIRLDPSLIDKPLSYADPQTTRLVTEFCEKQLIELNAEVSVVGAVTALIYKHISSPPTVEQSASILGVSSRSLRRHLQNADTSYTALLNNVRHRLAAKLLVETEAPISSIAYEVGFDNPSHFGRAFKQWTGRSPSEFRGSGSRETGPETGL